MLNINSTITSFLLFMVHFAQAQWTINGNILDHETKQPIEFAHLYDQQVGIGTTSNANGEFSMQLPDNLKSIVLTISHVGYSPLDTLITSDIDRIDLLLSPQSELLEAVTISLKNPYEILKQCISAIPKNYPNN